MVRSRTLVKVAAVLLLVLLGTACAQGDSGDGDSATDSSSPDQALEICDANQRMIRGAYLTFELEEGFAPESVESLVPGYLTAVPRCPEGGLYELDGAGLPICVTHGSLLE